MNRLRAAAWLLFLMPSILPAVAGSPEPKSIPFPDTTDSVVVPAGSPIRYSGIKNDHGEDVVTFRGRFLLTGTFYYGDNDFNDSGVDHPSEYVFMPQAYIIPDDNTAQQLPRFAIRNERQTIFLSNPTAFANAAISRTVARSTRCQTCSDATGHIAIWVDQFTATIECDHPSYEVRFLSVDKPTKLTLTPAPDRAC